LTWGYIISKANEEVFEERESHLIVASTIAALGATRQTRSHIKATIGVGNSVKMVKATVDMVLLLALWADKPITEPNVEELAQQIHEALRK
jgi:hypothetical protein